jgi:hypothetical protein
MPGFNLFFLPANKCCGFLGRFVQIRVVRMWPTYTENGYTVELDPAGFRLFFETKNFKKVTVTFLFVYNPSTLELERSLVLYKIFFIKNRRFFPALIKILYIRIHLREMNVDEPLPIPMHNTDHYSIGFATSLLIRPPY